MEGSYFFAFFKFFSADEHHPGGAAGRYPPGGPVRHGKPPPTANQTKTDPHGVPGARGVPGLWGAGPRALDVQNL